MAKASAPMTAMARNVMSQAPTTVSGKSARSSGSWVKRPGPSVAIATATMGSDATMRSGIAPTFAQAYETSG